MILDNKFLLSYQKLLKNIKVNKLCSPQPTLNLYCKTLVEISLPVNKCKKGRELVLKIKKEIN